MKYLKTIITPFKNVPSTIYLGIAIFWFCAFILLWYSAPSLIPSPKETLNQLMAFSSDRDFYEDLIASTLLTLKAMLISIIFASLLAYVSVTPLFKPIAYFLVKIRYMSIMGFAFTFTLLFHEAGQVKIDILLFGIVPFFTLSMLSVIEKISTKEYDMWTTLRYSKWEQVYQIIIRGKADFTLEAIRANFAMAWLMITMVETYSMADGGLGVLLFKANSKTQIDKIFALQIVIFILGVTFDYLLRQLRYKLFPHVALAEKK